MTYEIQFITDERFQTNKKDLQKMDSSLKKTGIEIKREGGIREVHFQAEDGSGRIEKQWRKTYTIEKGKFKNWDDAMTEINKIQAPYYKRI